MAETVTGGAWHAELLLRMRRHFLLKLGGTTAWVWAFFVGYFHLLSHVAYPVTVMPLTPLDAMVPVVPLAIVPYLSLWLYVGVAPGLQRTFRELLVYGLWAGLLCAAGLAIFYRWPTQIPTFAFDRVGLPGFALLQGIDTSGNACPSMHVAIAMFTAIWVDVLLRDCRAPMPLRAVNWVWFAAITFSTVAIRQHVVIDAVAGAALGAAFAAASLVRRTRHRLQAPGDLDRAGAPAMMPAIAGAARRGAGSEGGEATGKAGRTEQGALRPNDVLVDDAGMKKTNGTIEPDRRTGEVMGIAR